MASASRMIWLANPAMARTENAAPIEAAQAARVVKVGPLRVVQGSTRFVSIATGSYASAAIAQDGSVWTWGRQTSYGLLGTGNLAASAPAVLAPAKIGVTAGDPTTAGPIFAGTQSAINSTTGASSIDMAEYGEYVGHVAGQYCQNINIFEIWNEENIPRFWSGKPDAEAYGRMLKAAHQAITGACPEARVAFGGIASYDAETDRADRYGFLKRVAAAHPDICDYFEVVAFHPYTFMQYDPPERDVIIDDTLAFQGQSWQTAILKGILDEIGCPDKSVIISEQGWPSYDLTEQQVGLFLPRSILLAIREQKSNRMKTRDEFTFTKNIKYFLPDPSHDCHVQNNIR